MTPPITIPRLTLGQAELQDDEVLNIDDLLQASEDAAQHAVDFGDGGVGEVAMHFEALRLVLTALVLAVRESGRAR